MGLAHPVCSKYVQRYGNENFKVGACEMQGFRTEMEDAESIQLTLPNHTNYTYFGVFDGHNGSAASEWAAKNLHKYIDKYPEITPETIKQALLEADADFLQTEDRQHGTTAVFTLIERSETKPWKIIVGNVGDSRVLIGKNKGRITVPMTKDHKPTNQIESERIRKAGGKVEAGRVDGQLALSRALGDSPYKENPNLPQEEQRVIPVPDVTMETITEDDFIILCCDGIFESFTNEETVNFVAEALEKTDDLGQIACDLLDAVLARGSKDNMTVVIVQLKDGTGYGPAAEFLPGPFSIHKDNPSFVDGYIRNCQRYGITLEEALKKRGEPPYEPSPHRPTMFPLEEVARAMLGAGMKSITVPGLGEIRFAVDDDDQDPTSPEAEGESLDAEVSEPAANEVDTNQQPATESEQQ